MLIELSVLLALIAVNGLFAMSEIAVISSKRPRLAQLAERGNCGAARALELHLAHSARADKRNDLIGPQQGPCC